MHIYAYCKIFIDFNKKIFQTFVDTIENSLYNHLRFQEIENKNLSSSLVQSVERRTVNPYVASSSLAGGAT